MHGLVALFLVIALAIILLFVGLAVLGVLIVATRTIMALIVLMTIVGSLVVAIASVALMVVAILVATILLVAWFMAMCNGKVSRLLFFQLIFVLGNLLKNNSHFVSCLTLLKESNELEQVGGHCPVCIRKLRLMHLGLCKEEFFTLFLHCGNLHGLMEVATFKMADELYLTPHERVHWHEGRLLGLLAV